MCVDSTNFQPFYLFFGRTPRSPFMSSLPQMSDEIDGPPGEYLKSLVTGLTHAHEIAQQNMIYHKEKMKEQYDKKSYSIDY